MIKYKDINQKYDQFELYVEELKLNYPVTAILGHIGSGKTTLLKTLINATTGSYKTNDKNVVVFKPEVGKIVNDRIEKIMKYYSIFYKFDTKKAKKYFNKFKINTYDNYKNHSEGQKDIIAIILTMCCKADLYILDEPFSRIDPINRKIITNILIDEISSESRILIASHELPNVERLVDYIYLLKDGKVIDEKHIDELEIENSVKEWYREEYKKAS